MLLKTQLDIYIYIDIYKYLIYIYIYRYMCVCVCVRVCVWDFAFSFTVSLIIPAIPLLFLEASVKPYLSAYLPGSQRTIRHQQQRSTGRGILNLWDDANGTITAWNHGKVNIKQGTVDIRPCNLHSQGPLVSFSLSAGGFGWACPWVFGSWAGAKGSRASESRDGRLGKFQRPYVATDPWKSWVYYGWFREIMYFSGRNYSG